MAYEVRILPTAGEELEAIVAYLSGRSRSAASRFVQRYRERLELLASGTVDFGLSKLPELASLGYHACLVDDYVLLYYYEDDAVVVAHMFHQRQDYGRLVLGQ